MRARCIAAILAIGVATAVGAQALAATDKARIGAMQSLNGIPGNGTGAEGAVSCPAGERVLGGGIVTDISGDTDLRASGPMDNSSTMAGTKDGDRPIIWYAADSNFTGGFADFRLYAICAKADVVVETTKFEMPTGEGKQASATCPGSRRAVGGGVIQNGSAGGSFVRESGPVDGSGTFKRTQSGDVPRGWFAAMHNQGGSTYFKVYAICASGSNAKIEATKRQVPTGSGGFRNLTVDCPGAKRALGGGLLHSRGLDGYYGMTMSGPLDNSGTASETGVGDKPVSWHAGIENIFGGTKGDFKVLVVCE